MASGPMVKVAELAEIALPLLDELLRVEEALRPLRAGITKAV